MKIATGEIFGVKVVLEGEPLAEGSVVTVVAREDDETFDVSHRRRAGAAFRDHAG